MKKVVPKRILTMPQVFVLEPDQGLCDILANVLPTLLPAA